MSKSFPHSISQVSPGKQSQYEILRNWLIHLLGLSSPESTGQPGDKRFRSELILEASFSHVAVQKQNPFFGEL